MTTNNWLSPPINNKGQIVISTETRRGRTLRMLVLSFWSGCGALISILAYFALTSLDDRGASMMIAINVLLLSIGLAQVWHAKWGTWVIDNQFLEFRPCSGPPRRLSWNDVVLIVWSQRRAVFRGASSRIAIPWCYLSPQEVALAKGMIEKKLHDAFDLSDDCRPSRSHMAVLSFSRMARIAIISIITMSIGIGGSAILIHWPGLSAESRRNFGKAWTIFVVFVWLSANGWLNGTTARTRHRDWPWRARRTDSDRQAWRDDL